MKRPEDLKHPAYGMLNFSRVHHSGGGRKLFGSALATHYGSVRLRISPGVWHHDLHEDRYFADGTRPFIEVEMSAAQFAEAITSMNMGEGVPCTILYRDGKTVADPPDVETEVERVKANFKADLAEMIQTMRERRAAIEKATEKLSDKAKEKLRIDLDVMIQQLTSNIPFIAEQFNEAAERVTAAAKTEIEAFAMHTIHRAGIEAIAQGGKLPSLLPAPTKGDDDDA